MSKSSRIRPIEQYSEGNELSEDQLLTLGLDDELTERHGAGGGG